LSIIKINALNRVLMTAVHIKNSKYQENAHITTPLHCLSAIA